MGYHKRLALDIQDAGSQVIRLGDLSERQSGVLCWCNRCGHSATIPAGRLIAELGPGFAVPEVGTRMRCTGCNSKDVATRPV